MQIVSVRDGRRHFTELVRLAEGGTHVVIERHRKPVALLTRLPPELQLATPKEEAEDLLDMTNLLFDEECADAVAAQFAEVLTKHTAERKAKSHGKRNSKHNANHSTLQDNL